MPCKAVTQPGGHVCPPNIGQGVYYNGIPLVTEKAEYIRDNGFKGAYLWAGEYDVLGEYSLTGAVYQTLND